MRIPPGVRRTVTYYNVVFATSGQTPDPSAGYRAVGISGVARLLKELGVDEQRRAVSLDVLATDGHVTVSGVRLTDVRRSELGL